MPRQAVLVDLDDTLFDHTETTRAALEALGRTEASLRHVPGDELHAEHARILEEIHHTRVLSGHATIDEARIERFARLLEFAGSPRADRDEAARLAASYRQAYLDNERVVPGAIELLSALRGRATVAVVTNNLHDEQVQKLRRLELTPLVGALITSEAVGVAKPEPEIFRRALDAVDTTADAAVMLGDSWASDVVGASRAGIAAVWLNRYRVPCPDPAMAIEVTSLTPTERVLEALEEARVATRAGASGRGSR